MHRRLSAHKIAEELCANRTCLSYGYIRDAGTTPEAVLNLDNLPCRVFPFSANGIGWLCAEGASVPLAVRAVGALLKDALSRAKNGHVVIYYRLLNKLPRADYMRALRMLRALVHTCECEVRSVSYRCPQECVHGFLDALALKVKSTFGVQI